jgi:hypothetical protein
LGFGPCGEVDLGLMNGQSAGVQDQARDSSFWLALGPGVHLDWRLTSVFSLYGELGTLFPVYRPRWLLHDLGLAHRSQAMLLRALVALVFRL